MMFSSMRLVFFLHITLGPILVNTFIPSLPTRVQRGYTTSQFPQSGARQDASALSAKLWDRLQIEEDPEPFWYLLNCVAGLEIDLLRQCRQACKNMPDAVKFVVPTVTKTRSHGANRMVTETKVKYQGYVFAKLRLCEEVYEAIQGLDLCRSWMGTVNHKGYKKLPPAPVALNELEVENFGLEDLEFEEEEDESTAGVIVDTEEEDAESFIDQEALKVYLGLRVDDMVKVTAKGKFFDEDGIVKRLKDDKILVRFYTYGSMFDEWMEPQDVRKLSSVEVLKGLSGPSTPITQYEFDGRGDRGSYGDRRGPRDRPPSRNQMMRDTRGPWGGQRNRRQDRGAGDRYKRDFFGRTDDEMKREERNWNWYQEQNRENRQSDRQTYSDGDWSFQGGGRKSRQEEGAWAQGDVDSQWGRPSQRQQRRDNRKRQQPSINNVRNQDAIDGKGDWSSFVSPASSGSDSDDFFSSLMADLSKDLKNGGEANKAGQRSDSGKSGQTPNDSDDDFFASLMTELEPEGSVSAETRPSSKREASEITDDDDDFFATLEAEVGSALDEDPSKSSGLDETNADDFFASLEVELSSNLGNPITTEGEAPFSSVQSKSMASDANTDADDFFASLEESEAGSVSDEGDPNDFFASVEADMSSFDTLKDYDSIAEDTSPGTEVAHPPTQKASTPPPENKDLTKLTVPALKDMLRERGLKVGGRKAELIERLLEHSG